MMPVEYRRVPRVLAVYLGSLAFGALLILASLLGAGHDADVHVDLHVGDGHGGGDGHDQSQASALLALFGIRFWSFATMFFGATGAILHLFGGPALAVLAPFIAAAVGVAAGLGASMTFRALSRDTVGQLRPGALIGRSGRLLLPVARGQRGKVRIAVPGSGDVDLIAESDDASLDTGADVLIVEVRGNIAVVERAPETSPAGRS
jgi:membrane protein implicated in regulation of membrane protease activity